jgi:hypothetical protein
MNFSFKANTRIFVIPRNEESPQETPQAKSPIFVELLTEIATPVRYRSCPRSSE